MEIIQHIWKYNQDILRYEDQADSRLKAKVI